ncbi:hypothetical protein N2599_20060 [Rhizobium sullae]|uniref:Thiaminase-2/PQQC domain-containing protein n=1 Tax=Rhizobium sullae TaxID=50338 RepID=A0ABY5XIX7_RHISU|nr:hypothetical protein [Rhizobium sullae]UWU14377.1 hypothetical protein N2599_20060 [Rhizobium sullae]
MTCDANARALRLRTGSKDWCGSTSCGASLFVRRLGAGTLPAATIRAYLVLDCLFLMQLARAYALAAYKSRTVADIRAAQLALAAILDATELHVRLRGRGGPSRRILRPSTR